VALAGVAFVCGTTSSPLASTSLLGIEWDTQNLYEISPADATLTLLGTLDANLACLERGPDGFLYGYTTLATSTLYRIDPDTLQSEAIGPLGISTGEGALAFSPNGTAYGAVAGSAFDPLLFTINLNTGSATIVDVISDGPHDINAMAWRSDNLLVAVCSIHNDLIAIQPSTASSVVIAEIPPVVGGTGGIAILNGTAYFATSDAGTVPGSNALYTLNLFTGETTLIDYFAPTATLSGLAVADLEGPDVPAVGGSGSMLILLALLAGSIHFLRRRAT